MTENSNDRTTKRLVSVAIALSILMPGVGHTYCGKLLRGLLLGLLYAIGVPVVLGLLAFTRPASTVTFGLLMTVAAVGIVVAASVDAYRLARRTRNDYNLKAYNHPAIYVLLGLMIQGSCLGYALHVRASLFEAFRVPSASAYPTIVPHDRILVDKIAYRRSGPQRGDTVLFHPPDENWRTYHLKRIVALEGDSVEIKDGALYVNDVELPRSRLGSGATTIEEDGTIRIVKGDIGVETNSDATYRIFLAPQRPEGVRDFPRTTVPAHHCFVLGDNRAYSLDSRHFGPIPYAVIEGRADYIYWPADRWSRFGRID